ncbi:MAG: hypothetical protein ACFFCD_16595 [Promethearchaeota archaeon]
MGKIQTKLQAQAIKCSSSIVYCKPFKGYSFSNSIEKFESAINAYTFFKPLDQNLPYEAALSTCESIVEKHPINSIEAFWNNSLYPFVVSTRGDSFHDVVQAISLLRKQSAWAVDSSSYISLRIDPKSYEPIKDSSSKKISAVLFLKLASISDFGSVETRSSELEYLNPKPSGRLGWYDVAEWVECRNLHELYQSSLKLKLKSNRKISFVSTMLLSEVL